MKFNPVRAVKSAILPIRMSGFALPLEPIKVREIRLKFRGFDRETSEAG